MTKEEINKAIKEVEDYILYQKKLKQKHDEEMKKLPENERFIFGWFLETEENKNYGKDLEKIDYTQFVGSADCHYFVARVLMLNNIWGYSLFCAQQCVENYLKAYLKFRGLKNIPNRHGHDLKFLLEQCKEFRKKDKFINSEYLEIICNMFNPYNEVGRYPVQKRRSNGRVLISASSRTLTILDYFVFKMREILVIPEGKMDIFKNSHFELFQCQEQYPRFYAFLKMANAFFPE